MKYYSFNVYEESIKDELRAYLKENNIYYEISGYYTGWHFEIELSDEQVEIVNEFINRINEIRGI